MPLIYNNGSRLLRGKRSLANLANNDLFSILKTLPDTPDPNQNFYDRNLANESLFNNLKDLAANPDPNQDFYGRNLANESLFNQLKLTE